jgi:hypothetical protein
MKTIQGSIPAILTPMQDDGSLDLPCLQRLLDWHIAEGTDAVVVIVGTYRRIADRQLRRALRADRNNGQACRRAHSGNCRHRGQLH